MPGLKQINRTVLVSATIIVLLLMPLLSLAGKETKLYVDDDASGNEDGSSSHPYKTIGEALKHADKDTKINIRKGTYKENVEIPNGVELIGSDTDAVIIKADDKDRAVVKMNNDTKLMRVTIKDGEQGIKVKEGDKALIYKCEIKDNDENGIYIEAGEKSKKEEVSILKSKIKDNGRSGIFTQGRKVVIEDSEISGNKSDGIDLGSGTKAWIEGNEIRDNRGSGLKIELDGAEVSTDKNLISNNKREGIEVNLKWKSGSVNLKGDQIKRNSNFGISRVQRASVNQSLWNGLSVGNSVSFLENGKSNVSHIFKLF